MAEKPDEWPPSAAPGRGRVGEGAQDGGGAWKGACACDAPAGIGARSGAATPAWPAARAGRGAGPPGASVPGSPPRPRPRPRPPALRPWDSVAVRPVRPRPSARSTAPEPPAGCRRGAADARRAGGARSPPPPPPPAYGSPAPIGCALRSERRERKRGCSAPPAPDARPGRPGAAPGAAAAPPPAASPAASMHMRPSAPSSCARAAPPCGPGTTAAACVHAPPGGRGPALAGSAYGAGLRGPPAAARRGPCQRGRAAGPRRPRRCRPPSRPRRPLRPRLPAAAAPPSRGTWAAPGRCIDHLAPRRVTCEGAATTGHARRPASRGRLCWAVRRSRCAEPAGTHWLHRLHPTLTPNPYPIRCRRRAGPGRRARLRKSMDSRVAAQPAGARRSTSTSSKQRPQRTSAARYTMRAYSVCSVCAPRAARAARRRLPRLPAARLRGCFWCGCIVSCQVGRMSQSRGRSRCVLAHALQER